MTERVRPAHVLPVPRWTLIIHIMQAALAIIILGLAAYGVRWIPYNALIFSIVVALCTLAVSAYLLISQLFLHKIYNMYLVLGLHAWMLLFWIIDLGLVANLAHLWSAPSCLYYYGYGYSCSYGAAKRDLHPREDSTTVGAYYGALVAGAVFAAAEFVLFLLSLIILIIYMNKHRSNAAANAASHPPPQYTDNNTTHNNQAVPMEKFNQTGQPQQSYQQPYSAAPTPQPTYAQPVQGQYAQPPTAATQQYDPVNRTDTVSPASHAGYTGTASEIGTPQHTGNYNPNVSELSTTHTYGHYNPNVSELSTK